MTVSVVIPTYNSAATIGATLDSVLSQSMPAREIIVLDDGSSDETACIVSSYAPRVTLLRQQNQGVAAARNTLCKLAEGELLAFLDHDDLWHPQYLETQCSLFQEHTDACAFFTAHTNFTGYGAYEWQREDARTSNPPEVIDSLDFFVRYNEATGPFGSMSYCCLPKRTLLELGAEPFRISGVDDSYLCCQLALTGRPVIFSHLPRVAYRLTPEAQSDNRLKSYGRWVAVFQALEGRFQRASDPRMRDAFKRAYAAKRRSYAKILMGSGESREAREQFRSALQCTTDPISLAKSLGLLVAAYLPGALQPAWPSGRR